MTPTQTLLSEPGPRTAPAGPPPMPRRQQLTGLGAVLALTAAWIGLGSVLGAGLSGLLPLAVAVVLLIHLAVRRQPLRAAFGRDTGSVAARWPGRILVATVLLGAPAVMVYFSLSRGTYADDSWKALLLAALLGVGYAVSRRLLLTVLIGGVVVSMSAWVLAPNLASATNGDPELLAQLDQQANMGVLDGLHDVAVAEVDLNATHKVRLAGIGADDTTPMEVGSLTKAMTGLVIADAVRRGEVRMDAPVSTYLPALEGSRAGAVTMHELVTHTAGYAEFGAATLLRAAWTAPLGRGFITADTSQMTQEARSQTLSRQGRYAYSTLGAATAGEAVAAAAHTSYANLMRTRLFEPLAMTHTGIENDHTLVPGGQASSGLPVQAWVMGAYAPGGAMVSTTGDLAKLATALLDGTAPGMTALEPTDPTDQPNTRIGTFWHISTWGTGQTVTWHNGQTGGYASYFGLDRAASRAVIVLSDVATDNAASDLGINLLAHRE